VGPRPVRARGGDAGEPQGRPAGWGVHAAAASASAGPNAEVPASGGRGGPDWWGPPVGGGERRPRGSGLASGRWRGFGPESRAAAGEGGGGCAEFGSLG